MLGRKSLKEMSSSLILPIVLVIASLIFASHFDTVKNESNEIKMARDESGVDQANHRER